jgi:hypothetical protein
LLCPVERLRMAFLVLFNADLVWALIQISPSAVTASP